MVQLKSNLPVPFTDRPDNTYWAIGEEALQVKHKKKHFVDYSPNNPISGDEMINRANRKERGLLAYEKCKVAELKAFIEARKLTVPKIKRAKKADLIAALQKADNEVVFSKMLDLPPELRKMIYEEYVSDLPRPLPEIPHQPPLTMASSKIRKESRPTYLRDSTFVFTFKTTAGMPWVVAGIARLHTTCVDKTLTMLKLLSDQDVARIRHIHLRLIKPSVMGGEKLIASWNIDLNSYGGPKFVPTNALNGWVSHWYWDPLRVRINAAIPEVLSEIWQRAGVHKLQRTDIEALRQALHNALL